jgi:hypothetical protein
MVLYSQGGDGYLWVIRIIEFYAQTLVGANIRGRKFLRTQSTVNPVFQLEEVPDEPDCD